VRFERSRWRPSRERTALSLVRSSWKLKSTRAERSIGVEGSGSVSVYTHVRRATAEDASPAGARGAPSAAFSGIHP
jgi:hypothetical protein